MRLIDALELKRSISASVLSEDGKRIFDIIDEQPTIEERKTGKWIICDDGYVRCSECNTKAPWLTDEMSWMSDYCPNCGTKMEGEQP